MRCRKPLSIVALMTLFFFAAPMVVPPSADARPPRRKRRAKNGTLAVYCFIKDARIEVDGKMMGITPLTPPLSLPPGSYNVRVFKRGYQEIVETVEILNGQESDVDFDLIAVAGLVTISANVAGALVAIDGKIAGTVPFDKDIRAGKHEITVQAQGYLPFIQKTLIQAGKRHNYNVLKRTA